MCYHTIIIVILSSLLLSLPFPLRGEDARRLEEIVVTASRSETPLREVPANVSVITREEMKELGVTTVAEAFFREPGVFVNSQLNNPKYTDIDIRGYGDGAGRNTLFLIDGRRVTNIDLSGTDLAQVPVEMIERIEVYRGPGTVLYGDNAVAGVVNIILRKGEGGPKIATSVTTGSYNLLNPRVSLSGQAGALSYFAVTSSYESEGYRHNNDLRMKDAFTNLSFDGIRNMTVRLKAGHHRDQYGLPGNLSFRQLNSLLYDRKDTDEPFNRAATEDNFVDLGADIKVTEDLVLALEGSYRNRHNSSHFEGTGWFLDSMGKMETLSFSPRVTFGRPVFGFKNRLIVGFDYYSYPTSGSNDYGFTHDTTTINRKDAGFYADNTIRLTENLLFDIGYRTQKTSYTFDYYNYTGLIAPFEATTHDKKDAFRSSFTYLFSKDGKVFLSYGKGFRFPVTQELFNAWNSLSFPPRPPIDPDITAQTTKEWDLGVKWEPHKRISGEVTFFLSRSDNELFYNDLDFTNQNYGKTERRGIEARVGWIIVPGLRLDGTYSWVDARFREGRFRGKDIPLVPAQKLSGLLSYSYKEVMVKLISTYTGDRYMVNDLENRFRKLPGATVFDAHIRYGIGNLALSLAVKNLTGKKYDSYGAVTNGIPPFIPPSVGVFPASERQYFFTFEYALPSS